MSLDALFSTAHDLVVGAAIVQVLVCIAALFAGAYREWRRRRRPPIVVLDETHHWPDLKDALRVIGGGRRGPEPPEHLGKVKLP